MGNKSSVIQQHHQQNVHNNNDNEKETIEKENKAPISIATMPSITPMTTTIVTKTLSFTGIDSMKYKGMNMNNTIVTEPTSTSIQGVHDDGDDKTVSKPAPVRVVCSKLSDASTLPDGSLPVLLVLPVVTNASSIIQQQTSNIDSEHNTIGTNNVLSNSIADQVTSNLQSSSSNVDRPDPVTVWSLPIKKRRFIPATERS